MHRIVDGEASPHEWRDWSQAADRRPQLWRELAQVQRDHLGLVRAMGGVTARAASIDPLACTDAEWGEATEGCAMQSEAVPLEQVQASRTTRLLRSSGSVRRGLPFGAWAGWLAACVVLAWVVAGSAPTPETIPATTQQTGADVVPSLHEPSEYLDRYVASGRETGRVIDELPTKVLLQSRRTDAGYELVYVRQILERALVPDLYEFSAQDELGRWMPVRLEESGTAHPAVLTY